MCKICPKCKAIAEYNAYYGRITCTRCSWESENMPKERAQGSVTDAQNGAIFQRGR